MLDLALYRIALRIGEHQPRSLVGDSHGDSIDVTTVYPGYIRTPIHDAAAAHGLALEGVIAAERVSDAAAALARAALDSPVRDLATTRSGGFGHLLLRLIPRRLMDRLIRRRMQRAAAEGAFDSELASDLRAELLPGSAQS